MSWHLLFSDSAAAGAVGVRDLAARAAWQPPPQARSPEHRRMNAHSPDLRTRQSARQVKAPERGVVATVTPDFETPSHRISADDIASNAPARLAQGWRKAGASRRECGGQRPAFGTNELVVVVVRGGRRSSRARPPLCSPGHASVALRLS